MLFPKPYRKTLPCSIISVYRHILASLHFNENVNREKQTNKNGDKYYKVSYPKFKLGEEVVRDVPCPPTYGMNLHYLNSMSKLHVTVNRYHW